MKYFIVSCSILIVTLLLMSCGGKGSYYEQFTNDRALTKRILDLNKTIDEVRSFEKGKLIKDDVELLKYVYEIGENDTYIVSYLFDEKGCYEIGIDSYFELEKDAQNVVDGLQSEVNATEFGNPKEDNKLYRWLNSDESVSIELDHAKTKRGLFVATIFANK